MQTRFAQNAVTSEEKVRLPDFEEKKLRMFIFEFLERLEKCVFCSTSETVNLHINLQLQEEHEHMDSHAAR